MSAEIVIVDGIIGVGKTHLVRTLNRTHQSDVEVYAEPVCNPMLELFYTDPKHYGFALQLHMLSIRKCQLQLAKTDKQHNRVPPVKYFLWDRSIFGDYIFALWNHMLGNITLPEFLVYENLFGGSFLPRCNDANLLDNVLDPLINGTVSKHVFLFDAPRDCEHRIKDVRKNPAELGIPLVYLEGLDDLHFYMLLMLLARPDVATRIAVMTFAQYKTVTNMKQLIAQPLPRLKTISMGDAIALGSLGRSFITLNQLDNFVTMMKCPESIAQIGDTITIRVDEEMVLPTKIENPDVHPAARQIPFYHSSFKRAVVVALAHGKQVILITN